MTENAGPSLDREIAFRAFGEEAVRAPAYSTDNASADLLLWRIAQLGVAFRVQELEGLHYCMLWLAPEGSRRALTTASAESRPLAIGRAVLALCAEGPLRAARRAWSERPAARARA